MVPTVAWSLLALRARSNGLERCLESVGPGSQVNWSGGLPGVCRP